VKRVEAAFKSLFLCFEIGSILLSSGGTQFFPCTPVSFLKRIQRAAAVLYRYFRPALLLVSQHSPVLLLYFFALLSVLFVLQVSLCKNSR